VARVLVSLVDVRGAAEKYARAEAALAYDRFTDDFDEDTSLKSTDEESLSLTALLADFDRSGDVRPTGDGRFEVAVGAYLDLAAPLEGTRWRLATRALGDGRVTVRRRELYELLREAVRVRVADGLPLSVPDPIAAALDAEVRELKRALEPVERTDDVDRFEPGAFPPCVEALVERARADELEATGRFALLAFLASTGADFERAATLVGDASDEVRYQYERLAGDGAQFAPPSCATMQANGDCYDRDDLCEQIGHPLAYYERALDGGVEAAGD
jgi:DNA primase large subunit